MKSKTIKTILGVALFSSVALSASAHVPILKPNQFHVLNSRLVIESSFTEFPFQADFAMTSPHFGMTLPDGNQVKLIPVAKTKGAVYLEPQIEAEGTYRIYSGVRKGPVYRGVETIEGKLYFSGDTLRYAGNKIVMNYYSSADTYVTKDHAHYTARSLNTGVEIIPLVSPNELSLGGTLRLQVLNNGIPVENARVVVAYDDEHYTEHRDGDLYDVENIRGSNIYADSEGKFTFTPKQAGLVLLFVTVHKKIDSSLWESYNTSLTLEVHPPFGHAMHQH